jgi:hypothetical protein
MPIIKYLYTEGKIGDRDTSIPVSCDDMYIGVIMPAPEGWQYIPKNQTRGHTTYKTLDELQKNLNFN